MSEQAKAALLCIATEAQGERFIVEAAAQGCDVLLLTSESLKEAAWPRQAISEIVTIPTGSTPEQLCSWVSYLARHHRIERIVALSAQDLDLAALLREHMRLPGMGQSTTRLFSDRLAMRMRARRAGLAVLEFSPVLHYDKLRAFMDEVPGPWQLVPRSIASNEAPRPIETPQQLWRALDEMGDAQSNYLLERVPDGKIYFVESLSWKKEMVLARTLRYTTSNGVTMTRILLTDDLDARYLQSLQKKLLDALGMAAGVAHSVFRQAPGGTLYYFVETVKGIGPSRSADVIAAAMGTDLWVEWANLEAASVLHEAYQLPRYYQELSAGAALGQGIQLDAPEVVQQDDSGVLLRANSPDQIDDLFRQILGGISTGNR